MGWQECISSYQNNDKRVYNYGRQVEYQANGNPLLIDRNIAFMGDNVDVFQVADSNVQEDIDVDRNLYIEAEGFKHEADYIVGENNRELPKSTLAEIKNETIQEVQNELNTEITGASGPV